MSIEDCLEAMRPAVRAAVFQMPPCPRCGAEVLAPLVVKFRTDEQIYHYWVCDDCGHDFETRVTLPLRGSAI